ncbi:hypothetical protein [Natrinema halophilum]|uniref:Uncharacterized protein n=1 Tax=Natrinema halophilum TaxID=1699371 RepID=A0A7D5GHA7_9EURY
MVIGIGDGDRLAFGRSCRVDQPLYCDHAASRANSGETLAVGLIDHFPVDIDRENHRSDDDLDRRARHRERIRLGFGRPHRLGVRVVGETTDLSSSVAVVPRRSRASRHG